MESQNLKSGKLVLLSAKGVKNGKVQLCFAQQIDLGKAPTSIVGLLNASDDRFNQQRAQYAWLSGEVVDIKNSFGIDLSSISEGEELHLDIVDPRIKGVDKPLNIQITETTKGTDYDVANFETRAKRAGKDGPFIMKDGLYIYVNRTVVAGEARHTLIEGATQENQSGIAQAITDALG
jgi:hypothetical protein